MFWALSVKSDKTRPIALIDFGASRVKAALWLPSEDAILHRLDLPSPVLTRGPRGEREGRPEDYWFLLTSVLDQFYTINDELVDVWLCSEMHGFLLADPNAPKAITPYISWQDQRADYKALGKPSILEVAIHTAGSAILSATGLKLRSGLPSLSLLALKGLLQRARPVRFLSLVDWLLVRGGERYPKCHATLAAGTGLYSLEEKNWSASLGNMLGIDFNKLVMPEVTHDLSRTIGSFNLSGRVFRAWGGIGDLQAAAYGLGFPAVSSVLINLGTGSQVLVKTSTNARDPNCEVRLSAEGIMTHAVTHIPCGRALNIFASFINECSAHGGGEPWFWKRFSNLNFERIIESTQTVDCNVFVAAWRYANGGSISNILESGFTSDSFVESLARSWLEQYKDAMITLPRPNSESTFVLGGGLSRIGDFVVPVLENLLQRSCVHTQTFAGEESLDGLLQLANQYFLMDKK